MQYATDQSFPHRLNDCTASSLIVDISVGCALSLDVCNIQSLCSTAFIIIIVYPLTARVIGAPQMTLQPVFSIYPCSPLPSGIWRTPGLSIPWCCLPTSSSVCLVLYPLSLRLADLMNGWHDHTTTVCVSLWWSGGLFVVRLPAALRQVKVRELITFSRPLCASEHHPGRQKECKMTE